MNHEVVGKILSIALRTAVRGPMREVREVVANDGGGLIGDVPASPKRGITFLASGQWKQVTRKLGAELPWHTRRANVLIDADTLIHLKGRTIDIGEVTVEILAETKPCELMDELQPGLRSALTPDCRAGVYGRVIRGGTLRVGDMMRAVASV